MITWVCIAALIWYATAPRKKPKKKYNARYERLMDSIRRGWDD